MAEGNATDNPPVKLKFPRGAPIIVVHEFFERCSFYGVLALLVIYLSQELKSGREDATAIYHAFTTLIFLMVILGAIISDSWLGKFKTVIYMCLLNLVGSILLPLADIPTINLPPIPTTSLALILIAIGCGGRKPCIAAFGGDQYKMPEQFKQMERFFSVYYFITNLAAVVAMLLMPILRVNVHCFGEMSCYSLAFGVSTILMLTAVVVFIFGRPFYVIKPPEGNMVLLVSKAIGRAIITRCKERKSNPKPHWLDYAENKYGPQLVQDIKIVLRILVLYIPLSVFWAVYDQQASTWVLQGTRMDGVIGPIEILPEQMQLVNPILVLVFIPLFEVCLYPLLDKVGMSTQLRKLGLGTFFAGLAFVCAALVEWQLEKTYPELPTAEYGQLRIYNGVPKCSYNAETNIPKLSKFSVNSMSIFTEKKIKLDKGTSFSINLKPKGISNSECKPKTGTIQLKNKEATSYYLHEKGDALEMLQFTDSVEKPLKGNPEVRILANVQENVVLKNVKNDEKVTFNGPHPNVGKKEAVSGNYDVLVGEKKSLNINIRQGGVYAIMLSGGKTASDSQKNAEIQTVTEPNSLHMLWLVPQYVILTIAEVMFSITGLQFSYSEAPTSMKSVVQAFWQLTVAIGNFIVILVAASSFLSTPLSEFVFFAVLVFICVAIYAFLAYRYELNNPPEGHHAKD